MSSSSPPAESELERKANTVSEAVKKAARKTTQAVRNFREDPVGEYLESIFGHLTAYGLLSFQNYNGNSPLWPQRTVMASGVLDFINNYLYHSSENPGKTLKTIDTVFNVCQGGTGLGLIADGFVNGDEPKLIINLLSGLVGKPADLPYTGKSALPSIFAGSQMLRAATRRANIKESLENLIPSGIKKWYNDTPSGNVVGDFARYSLLTAYAVYLSKEGLPVNPLVPVGIFSGEIITDTAKAISKKSKKGIKAATSGIEMSYNIFQLGFAGKYLLQAYNADEVSHLVWSIKNLGHKLESLANLPLSGEFSADPEVTGISLLYTLMFTHTLVKTVAKDFGGYSQKIQIEKPQLPEVSALGQKVRGAGTAAQKGIGRVIQGLKTRFFNKEKNTHTQEVTTTYGDPNKLLGEYTELLSQNCTNKGKKMQTQKLTENTLYAILDGDQRDLKGNLEKFAQIVKSNTDGRRSDPKLQAVNSALNLIYDQDVTKYKPAILNLSKSIPGMNIVA